MRKTTRVITNTATDTGLLFQEGNTVLNWQAGGSVGVVFNMVAAVVCLGLRARAEARKNTLTIEQPGLLQRILNNPNTALAFSGVAQLGVAAAATCMAGSVTVGAAIPAFFGAGNTTAACHDSLEQARVNIANFIMGKTAGTLLEDATRSNAVQKIGSVAWNVLTTPALYFTTGLVLAGGSAAAGTIFIGAGVLAVTQALWKADPDLFAPLLKSMPSPVARGFSALMNAEYLPILGLATGSFVAAGFNVTVDKSVAAATGLFALGYSSIVALQRYGGVAETARAGWARIRGVSKSPQPC